jgi:hypothetical protein
MKEYLATATYYPSTNFTPRILARANKRSRGENALSVLGSILLIVAIVTVADLGLIFM